MAQSLLDAQDLRTVIGDVIAKRILQLAEIKTDRFEQSVNLALGLLLLHQQL